MAIWPEFCGGSYRLETPNSGCDFTRNMFPQMIERGARAGQYRIVSVPGYTTFYTMPQSPIRAMWSDQSIGRLFVVAGSKLYEVFPDAATSPTGLALQGDVEQDDKPALIESNGNQLVIASNGKLFINPQPGLVTPLVFDGTTDPVDATTLAFKDLRFIGNQQNSFKFVWSELAPDGGTWKGSSFASKESYADNIARVYHDGTYLWLHGYEVSEVWDTSSDSNLPYERVTAGSLRIGCTAPYSVAGYGQWHAWLWGNQIWAAEGSAPKRISDNGIEWLLRTFTGKPRAEAFCYQWGGHLFYEISFIEANRTFVYDRATGQWHERSWFTSNGDFWRSRGRCYARVWDRHFVGDYSTGTIYEMRADSYKDADPEGRDGGVPLVRERVAPYITNENKNMRYAKFALDCDTGVGLDGVAPGDLGYDPMVELKYSRDRGKNYSTPRMESLGPIGLASKRVEWRQCGSARLGMTFNVRCTDPVPFTINGAYVDVG